VALQLALLSQRAPSHPTGAPQVPRSQTQPKPHCVVLGHGRAAHAEGREATQVHVDVTSHAQPSPHWLSEVHGPLLQRPAGRCPATHRHVEFVSQIHPLPHDALLVHGLSLQRSAAAPTASHATAMMQIMRNARISILRQHISMATHDNTKRW
jgi:hypothetical protein